MRLKASRIIDEARGPGQFLNILIEESWDLPLRRPMSIAGIEGDQMTIIYKTFGRGTKQLSEKVPPQKLNVLGPLGNMFQLEDNDHSYPVLVGGGVGIAPILWLHTVLDKRSIRHDLIIGARTSSEHFLEHDPNEGTYLATDDGTMGERGTVMPTLIRLVQNHANCRIFSCGPEPMLKAIQRFVNERGLPCQMAVESYMACGVGLCQGCVIETVLQNEKEHTYHERFSLVCCDGPVYQSRKVKFF